MYSQGWSLVSPSVAFKEDKLGVAGSIYWMAASASPRLDICQTPQQTADEYLSLQLMVMAGHRLRSIPRLIHPSFHWTPCLAEKREREKGVGPLGAIQAVTQQHRGRGRGGGVLALKQESRILGHSSSPVWWNRLDSVLFAPWRTGLALPWATYRLGPLSENPTLVL